MNSTRVLSKGDIERPNGNPHPVASGLIDMSSSLPLTIFTLHTRSWTVDGCIRIPMSDIMAIQGKSGLVRRDRSVRAVGWISTNTYSGLELGRGGSETVRELPTTTAGGRDGGMRWGRS